MHKYNNMELSIRNELQNRISKQKKMHRAVYQIADEGMDLEKKDIAYIKLWKATRSIYLYLNRIKKDVFGFNTHVKKLWLAFSASKKRLLLECREKLINCAGSDKYKKSLTLLIGTICNYRDDYGMTIGLVLNRSFYWPIPHLIYEYL